MSGHVVGSRSANLHTSTTGLCDADLGLVWIVVDGPFYPRRRGSGPRYFGPVQPTKRGRPPASHPMRRDAGRRRRRIKLQTGPDSLRSPRTHTRPREHTWKLERQSSTTRHRGRYCRLPVPRGAVQYSPVLRSSFQGSPVQSSTTALSPSSLSAKR